MIDTMPVAKVNHDNSLLGRSSVTIPANAATHASGWFIAIDGARCVKLAICADGRNCSNR